MNDKFTKLLSFYKKHDKVKREGGMLMSVKTQTIELKQSLQYLKKQYYQREKPENKRDPAFFSFVKTETAPIFELVDSWAKETAHEVKQRHLRIHPQQVASTKENVELLLLHSYYIDVREKRYMNLYNSVCYILDIILEDSE